MIPKTELQGFSLVWLALSESIQGALASDLHAVGTMEYAPKASEVDAPQKP